jgi:purine catabolism regulator
MSANLHTQPTLRQLLAHDALLEATIAYGEHLLDKPVSQVVFGLNPLSKIGTLAVCDYEKLSSSDIQDLKDHAGVILIGLFDTTSAEASMASKRTTVAANTMLEKTIEKCTTAKIPLLVLSEFGDISQTVEDIRLAFLSEIKKISARLHTYFISLVLTSGLETLAEELSLIAKRPAAIESADFQLLASSQNMGTTPNSQQKILTEQVRKELKKQMQSKEDWQIAIMEHPFKIGRRLSLPIVLDENVVGYVSLLTKPSDEISLLTEYLYPATLAALVDFTSRQKGSPTFAVTQSSLLKDLLTGRSVSASDQERVERHFGFDLCDGMLVFAIQVVPSSKTKDVNWPRDKYAIIEIEGTNVVVIPFEGKQGKTWQQEAEALREAIKAGSKEFKIQIGAGRLAQNVLDLSDTYREARQALIVGSMVNSEKEFVLGYGDLGIKRLLYLMIDHPELERFYEENLAPLESYDAEWESELIPTLRVYLEHGANLNSAAKALFIHRHTMRYRLEQIAELLKVDIDSSEILLNLQIAFQIKDMKGKSNL